MSGLQPVDFTKVSMDGAFWRERLDTVLNATIPSQHVRLVEHGLLDSLKLPQPVTINPAAAAAIVLVRCGKYLIHLATAGLVAAVLLMVALHVNSNEPTLVPLARSKTCRLPPCFSEVTSSFPSGVTAKL